MYLLFQKKHFHFPMLNVLKGAKTNQHRPRFKMPHPHSTCFSCAMVSYSYIQKIGMLPKVTVNKCEASWLLGFPYQTKIQGIIIVGATFEGKSWCWTRTLSCNLLFLDNCKSLDHLAIYSKSAGPWLQSPRDFLIHQLFLKPKIGYKIRYIVQEN